MCRIDLSAGRHHRHIVKPGSLGKRDSIICPGSEEGRRRSISVVAAVPVTMRATTLIGRRWEARGEPEGRR
jgi:hypothetical protein